MKLQPMNDAEIAKVVSSAFADDSELSESERVLVSAIIAARDAQWAAMIGEPVAWAAPDGSLFWSYSLAQQQACKLGDKDASPLYAIKEPTK